MGIVTTLEWALLKSTDRDRRFGTIFGVVALYNKQILYLCDDLKILEQNATGCSNAG